MNGMVAQIHSIPDLIRNLVPKYDEAIRSVLDPLLVRSTQRIYLTGCGDSHFVSVGSELAFEHLTGAPTEALTALQFSRYTADTIPRCVPVSRSRHLDRARRYGNAVQFGCPVASRRCNTA